MKNIDSDENKNQVLNDSPLTRRSVEQRSVGSTYKIMSSTAAAKILGINNISKKSESVKNLVSVLGEFYNSVKTGQRVLGLKSNINASNFEGYLVSLGLLKREGTGGSSYRYDDGNVVPLSKRFDEKKDDIRYMLDLNPEGFQDDRSSSDIIKIILNKVENNKTPETKRFRSFVLIGGGEGSRTPVRKSILKSFSECS